jgi:hypothetical protein
MICDECGECSWRASVGTLSHCCYASLVDGDNKLVRVSEHRARKDHKDGKIKKGESYIISVIRCWRRHGPSWIVTRKLKTNTPKPIFGKFRLLKFTAG